MVTHLDPILLDLLLFKITQWVLSLPPDGTADGRDGRRTGRPLAGLKYFIDINIVGTNIIKNNNSIIIETGQDRMG